MISWPLLSALLTQLVLASVKSYFALLELLLIVVAASSVAFTYSTCRWEPVKQYKRVISGYIEDIVKKTPNGQRLVLWYAVYSPVPYCNGGLNSICEQIYHSFCFIEFHSYCDNPLQLDKTERQEERFGAWHQCQLLFCYKTQQIRVYPHEMLIAVGLTNFDFCVTHEREYYREKTCF